MVISGSALRASGLQKEIGTYQADVCHLSHA